MFESDDGRHHYHRKYIGDSGCLSSCRLVKLQRTLAECVDFGKGRSKYFEFVICVILKIVEISQYRHVLRNRVGDVVGDIIFQQRVNTVFALDDISER